MLKVTGIMTLCCLLALPILALGAGNPQISKGDPIAPHLANVQTDVVSWTQVANAPHLYGRTGAGVLGNYMYVFGSEGSNIAMAFNLTTEQWENSTPATYGYDNWPTVATNSAIFLIGRGQFTTIDDKVQRFVPTGSGPTGTWTLMAHYPHMADGIAAAWDGDDYIYAAGGYENGASELNTAYKYKISQDQWNAVANLPEPMCFSGGAFVAGKFHVLGGTTHGVAHYAYDPINNSWAQKAPVPISLDFGTYSVTANQQYIFSVGGGGGYAGWPAYSDVWIYNPATDTWAAETSLPAARGNNTACWVGNGKVISGGGFSTTTGWSAITYRGIGFPSGGGPNLQIYLTPLNPPVVIPPGGGSFGFNIAAVDSGPSQTPFAVWARIKNPDGTWTTPTIGPLTINPPLNFLVSRNRTQNVPGTWQMGQFALVAYVALAYPGPIIDSSFFGFIHGITGADGPFLTDASCTGEPFPGEVIAADKPGPGVSTIATPNPFNPTTTISYQLPTAGEVRLQIFDAAGRMVATLVNGREAAGTHRATFDGSRLASGIYLYRLTADGQTLTGKVMLLK